MKQTIKYILIACNVFWLHVGFTWYEKKVDYYNMTQGWMASDAVYKQIWAEAIHSAKRKCIYVENGQKIFPLECLLEEEERIRKVHGR